MNNKKTILITALIILIISLITTVSVVVYNKNHEGAATTSTIKETKKTVSAKISTTESTTASTTAAATTTTKAAATKKRITTTTAVTTTAKQTISADQEFRAVWISYLDLQMKSEGGGTASSFTSKVDTMFSNVKNMGLNTVIVQVRPFSDAYYDSGIFPWSYYISGQQGKALNYDPLKILVQEAHKYGLQIHAWVNPYRVSLSNSPFRNSLSADNPASTHSDWLLKLGKDDNNLYYNPGITDVQKMVIDGVREIVQNYGVDGIHIDDYFYPTSGSFDDSAQYNAYVASGGQKCVEDWRRDNVDALISGIYSAIKAINGNVKFGISPAGGISKCYTSYYANVQEWSQNPGYCDYIVPQVYFGFQNQYMPFEKVATDWSNLATCNSVKLYYGLAFQKCGLANDSNAGTGCYEWANNSNIIFRQVQYARNLNRYGGFALFSYHCVFQNSNQIAVTEYQNLISIL